MFLQQVLTQQVLTQLKYHKLCLVRGFKHDFYFPFHIWDIILPIDELHHFSRCFFNHQPDLY